MLPIRGKGFFEILSISKIQNATNKRVRRLENIKNNNKDYQKIERLAEQKANDIL
jgi:hypothetical protein